MFFVLPFDEDGDGRVGTYPVNVHRKLNLAVKVRPAKLHTYAGIRVCRCVSMYYASAWIFDPNFGIELFLDSERKNFARLAVCVQCKSCRVPVDNVAQS